MNINAEIQQQREYYAKTARGYDQLHGNKAIFISDSNNFGQGTRLSRMIKQSINLLGLWKVADFIKTKGKGYSITEGDRLAYSYSVFNNYQQIKSQCKQIHILNTKVWLF